MVGARSYSVGKSLFLLAPFLAGCASTVDMISSQRFKDAPFTTLFQSDDPLETLRTSDEADLRAKAMLEIKEPSRSGAAEEQQFEVLQLLATAATSDRHALCRLRAIEALGRFEDPRTSHILTTAYQLAGQEGPADNTEPSADGVIAADRRTKSKSGAAATFTADTVATIQCRAVEALGKKQTPEAMALLCQIATTPAKRQLKKDEVNALNPPPSGHDQFDLRLAAVRSLANFKNEPAAAQALFQVMTTERDPALRNRAHQGLAKVTGQDYPPDSAEWETFMRVAHSQPPHPRSAGAN
jgi:HEAT repeat protein